MSDPPPDDVAGAASPDIDESGVDRAQIRAMLALSPEERLRVVEEHVKAVRAIRKSNQPPRLR